MTISSFFEFWLYYFPGLSDALVHDYMGHSRIRAIIDLHYRDLARGFADASGVTPSITGPACGTTALEASQFDSALAVMKTRAVYCTYGRWPEIVQATLPNLNDGRAYVAMIIPVED